MLETVLQRGFRCRGAQRIYRAWLEQPENASRQPLLLLECELDGLIELFAVPGPEPKSFELVVAHPQFEARISAQGVGSLRELELSTLQINHFEGDVDTAIRWSRAAREAFRVASPAHKAPSSRNNKTTGSEPGWFGRPKQHLEC